MSAGRIVADGSPSSTLDAGHIRGVFGVDPAHVRLPVGAA
jgi:ABC-type cobalamin/Fe3+-siderophores transport system ATPase subunit